MLAADHRLRDSDAFRRTVRSGRRAGSHALVVHVLVGTDASRPTTAGLVVSKAVGGAVVRNGVKRRLRHLLRSHLDELPAGSEVVVRALPAAASASSEQLGTELARGLSRCLSRGATT